MIKFFAGLRMVLALDYNKVVLGEVILDLVENKYLPSLRRKLDKARDESERERLQELIDLWEPYGDRKTSQGADWNKMAAAQVTNATKKWGLGNSDAEELAADVAGLFFIQPATRKNLENFDPEKGPERLGREWRGTVYRQVMDRIMKKFAEKRGGGMTRIEPDNGFDPIEYVESNVMHEIDKDVLTKIRRQMEKYVRKTLGRDDVAQAVFARWLAVATEKGPEYLRRKMVKEVYEPVSAQLADRGKNVNVGGLSSRWKKIKQAIVDFFEEEKGIILTDKAKRSLKVSCVADVSEEGLVGVVASNVYRARFAEWMLSVMRRG